MSPSADGSIGKAQSVACEFWRRAGGWSGPRADLTRAVATGLPVDVVALAALSVSRVQHWLHERGVPYVLNYRDRPLYGCLLAYQGCGFIFLDGSGSESDRRFTLAHEIAHFLLDYVAVRHRACEVFGRGILEVLDGSRPPSASERVHGALLHVSVGAHVHMLERGVNDEIISTETQDAEQAADLLAFELIAPSAEIIEQLVRANQRRYDTCVSAALELIEMNYGLPAAQAKTWAKHLSCVVTGGPTVMERFGW